MNQYLTTYKKDYVWPSTRIRHIPPMLRDVDTCPCEDTGAEQLKPLEFCAEQKEWSRITPMGRLLDPKLYPSKTGPTPESEATKFDQPSTYMRKLEEKFPNLYGILQSTPVEEVIKRVDEDRLKSTYQADYTEEATKTMKDSPMKRCATITPANKEECRAVIREQNKRELRKAHQGLNLCGNRDEDDGQEIRIPPWRTEYQDNIAKLGDAIMKSRIHQKRKQGPAWMMPS